MSSRAIVTVSSSDAISSAIGGHDQDRDTDEHAEEREHCGQRRETRPDVSAEPVGDRRQEPRQEEGDDGRDEDRG
jgi:hypothetical protein